MIVTSLFLPHSIGQRALTKEKKRKKEKFVVWSNRYYVWLYLNMDKKVLAYFDGSVVVLKWQAAYKCLKLSYSRQNNHLSGAADSHPDTHKYI